MTIHPFLRFLIVGGLNTLVGYGLFALFVLLGAGTTLSLAGATLLGILFNFKSIGHLVFGSVGRRRLPAFVGVYGLQFLINLGAMKALQNAGMTPLLAQLIILPPLAVATFLMMRRLVFPSAPRPQTFPHRPRGEHLRATDESRFL